MHQTEACTQPTWASYVVYRGAAACTDGVLAAMMDALKRKRSTWIMARVAAPWCLTLRSQTVGSAQRSSSLTGYSGQAAADRSLAYY
jgi:hypothetical protein